MPGPPELYAKAGAGGAAGGGTGVAAKRRMGMDEGKIALPPDWDSPETNAAIAALFGATPRRKPPRGSSL